VNVLVILLVICDDTHCSRLAGQGCAVHALQILDAGQQSSSNTGTCCFAVFFRSQEVSLQADLRAVVARALSGLDMFSEADGKLSPTVSAGVVTPFSPQPSSDLMAGMRGMSGQATVVPRKTTLREGVFTGLTTLMNQAAPTQVTRHSSTGGAITPGEHGSKARVHIQQGILHGLSA
jgi:hypothetical protein